MLVEMGKSSFPLFQSSLKWRFALTGRVNVNLALSNIILKVFLVFNLAHGGRVFATDVHNFVLHKAVIIHSI